jgi:hypothetical protein
MIFQTFAVFRLFYFIQRAFSKIKFIISMVNQKIRFFLVGESGVISTGFCFSCVGRFLITRFVK